MAILKESKRRIVGASSYEKEGNSFFRIEYLGRKKTGTYEKDGQTHDKLDKVIEWLIVPGDVILNDKNFVGKDKKEICQVLQEKSIVISTKIE